MNYIVIMTALIYTSPSPELVTALKAAISATESFLSAEKKGVDLTTFHLNDPADILVSVDPSLEPLFVAESELPPSKLTLDELMSLLKTPATIQ